MIVLVALIFVILSGSAEGVMDFLQFHYKGVNSFWNPTLSWVNKWKLDENGKPIVGKPRFFLSSTLLVALTDGWHLMKMVRNLTATLALIFFIYAYAPFLTAFVLGCSARIVYGLSFTILYRKL